jgi:uncharacterized membrane protein
MGGVDKAEGMSWATAPVSMYIVFGDLYGSMSISKVVDLMLVLLHFMVLCRVMSVVAGPTQLQPASHSSLGKPASSPTSRLEPRTPFTSTCTQPR